MLKRDTYSFVNISANHSVREGKKEEIIGGRSKIFTMRQAVGEDGRNWGCSREEMCTGGGRFILYD